MTIPWIDQSSHSVQNAEPVCCKPVNRWEEPPQHIESSQPEYSDIHSERNSPPPEGSENSLRGITPLKDNPISFSDFCLTVELPLEIPKPSSESLKKKGCLDDSFLNREIIYRPRFFCTPPFLSDAFYKSNKGIFNQSEAENFTRPRLAVKDFGCRSFARLSLRLSLLVFLLCALDTGSLLHSQKIVSTQKTVVTVFPNVYLIQNARGSDFQRIARDKVWCDPRQDSRTVGKHRCHCTKNSFFISRHNIGENRCILHPEDDICKN